MKATTRWLSMLLLVVAAPHAALAADGVIEIDQAAVEIGGIAADGGEWDEEDSDEGTFGDEFILFDPTEDA